MSKIKLTGHASGSGVLTIAAPNTDSDRTITLPDVTGTLLDSGSDLPAANLTGTVADARISTLTASKLTGDLPAISGANLTGVVTGATVLAAFNNDSISGITTATDWMDNAALRLGNSNDLQIYHDGTHSYIKDVGTGDLRIKGTELSLRSDSQDEPYINCAENGSVDLFYNNTKTFETMDGGAKVNGTFQNGNVAEASTNINQSTKTVTITGLHTLNPGNHWDRLSIWMWLTGTDGDYNDTQSKHWRHECQVIGPYSIASATQIYGGTPPTISTVTSGSGNSTLQFTVSQASGNAALRIVAFQHSMSSNCKISFS